MKRYRFRLDPVRRVRQIEQDAAQAELAAAQHGLTSAESARALAVERYEARGTAAGPSTAASWLVNRCADDRAAAAVWAADGSRAFAVEAVEHRRHALQEARARTNALERLDERRRGEHRLLARRQEDADTDELVTARHGRAS